MGYQLDRERSIRDVAKLAGMSESTMRRRLLSLHREHGGLLVQYGTGQKKIYRVTLTSLRKAMPHVFLETQATVSDVEILREQLAETRAEVRAVAARLRAFQRQAWEWFHRSVK